MSAEEMALATATAVREACIATAQQAYEEAGISGLCAEGRWENALGAMQMLDVGRIVAAVKKS